MTIKPLSDKAFELLSRTQDGHKLVLRMNKDPVVLSGSSLYQKSFPINSLEELIRAWMIVEKQNAGGFFIEYSLTGHGRQWTDEQQERAKNPPKENLDEE